MKPGRKPKDKNKKFKCIQVSLSPLAYQKYQLIPSGERSNRISKFLERVDPDIDVSEHGQRFADPSLAKRILKKLKQKKERKLNECKPKRKSKKFHVEPSTESTTELTQRNHSGFVIADTTPSYSDSIPSERWDYLPGVDEPSE